MTLHLNSRQRKSLVGLIGQWGKDSAHLHDTPNGVLARRGGPEGPVWWIGPDGAVQRLVSNPNAQEGTT